MKYYEPVLLPNTTRRSCYYLFIIEGNLVIPSIFAVTQLLRENSDALNQSNLRNFSAYIINRVVANYYNLFLLVRFYFIIQGELFY